MATPVLSILKKKPLSAMQNLAQPAGPSPVTPQPGVTPAAVQSVKPVAVTVQPPAAAAAAAKPPEPPPVPYAQQVANTAMQKLAQGLNGPSAGTQAAMDQANETMAQYARQVEAQAGARAAKTGALGQGSANALADDTRQNIMARLAQTTQANTQLVSDEQKSFMDRAIQAGEASQNIQNQTRSLDQASMQMLERLGGDIPVVATKLMDFAMGKTTGALTPEEKTQLNTWYAEQKAKGEKLEGNIDKLIEKAISDATTTSPTETREKTYESTMSRFLEGKSPLQNMTPSDWQAVAQDPAQLAQLAQNNSQIKPNAVVPTVKSGTEWSKAGLQSGDIVFQNGKPYRIIEFKTDRYKNFWGNTRGRNYTLAQDLTTNTQVRLGDTGEYDPD